MPVDGFTRRLVSDVDRQPVAILAMNTKTRVAQGLTNVGTTIDIDCRYAVGGNLILPAVGDQWYVERFNSVWRLYQKIPFNCDNLLVEPREGQVVIGGTGPIELNGSQVNAHGPLRLPAYPSDGRPDATDPGLVIYDTTLNQPVFSDGSGWRDASGETV